MHVKFNGLIFYQSILNVLNKDQGTHVIMESKNTENTWESKRIVIDNRNYLDCHNQVKYN